MTLCAGMLSLLVKYYIILLLIYLFHFGFLPTTVIGDCVRDDHFCRTTFEHLLPSAFMLVWQCSFIVDHDKAKAAVSV